MKKFFTNCSPSCKVAVVGVLVLALIGGIKLVAAIKKGAKLADLFRGLSTYEMTLDE